MSEGKLFRVLVSDWRAACNAFIAALDHLPPNERETPGLCGEWNAKQVVAHLSGWHYEAFRRFVEVATGDPFDKQYDVDAFNALQVEGRAHLTWEQTVSDLLSAIDVLRIQVDDIPDSVARAEPRYGEWMRGLTADLENHRQQVMTWLAAASA